MNNRIEITANCSFVGKIEEVGAKKFRKRTFVLEETEEGNKYPTRIAFTLKQEKTLLVKSDDVGKKLKVIGYVESREWQGKYYTELTAFNVARVQESEVAPQQEEVTSVPFEDMSDIPF
jgi:hypothetical protein